MRLKSIPLAITIIVLLFGGIGLSMSFNWWQTESNKTPARYSEGEAAGEFNPADIRGSYTFGDINKNFGIPLDDLRIAFRLPDGSDPATFPVKSLEELYSSMPIEMGTGAVKLFTAFYNGLPYELDPTEDNYLFPEAAAILKSRGKMTEEQAAYLSTHTLSEELPPIQSLPAETLPQDKPAAEPTTNEQPVSENIITGKTTFQNLLDMGMTAESIEAVIGNPIPSPLKSIKDYAAENGLQFSALKEKLLEKMGYPVQ